MIMVTESKWGELVAKVDKALHKNSNSTKGTEDMAEQDDNRWKLDKHIPVAVIFTIVVQGAAGVWWVSGLDHSVQDHERRLVIQEAAKISERMAVVEVQMREGREQQNEISHKLDRLLESKGLGDKR